MLVHPIQLHFLVLVDSGSKVSYSISTNNEFELDGKLNERTFYQ